MKYALFFVLLFIVGTMAQAQTTEDSVKAAVNLLIEAMKNSDSVKMASAFADGAILQTVKTNQSGFSSIQTWPIASQAILVPGSAIDEQLGFETIRIDGPLAMVWAPFKLYINLRLFQYGVASFQLVRSNGKWKIQYLIETHMSFDIR
ncbi:MAG TPA: hypothetical protein VGM41_15705 [Chitinophagaceae bacterium]|jgi:hypothetical protein